MRIPKRFKLLGQTIEVVFEEKLVAKDDIVGAARYRTNEIALQPCTEGCPRKPEAVEQTFFHELLHFALDAMGRNELRQEEAFVDMLAGLLHQALTTAEYDALADWDGETERG